MTCPFNTMAMAIALNTHRVLELLERTTPDTTHRQALKERIIQREETGFKKYGRTMDRRDYTLADWHLHLLEELMDAAQYAMRAGDTELAGYLLDDAYRIQQRIENS
jgi:phosphopentomutase